VGREDPQRMRRGDNCREREAGVSVSPSDSTMSELPMSDEERKGAERSRHDLTGVGLVVHFAKDSPL
jgi:hypothetical protein